MKTIRLLLFFSAALVATSLPRSLAAQSSCQFACKCTAAGCACMSGSKGVTCEATGTTCTLTKCPSIAFAGDGSVVDLGEIAPRFAPSAPGPIFGGERSVRQPTDDAPAPEEWEALEDGHLVRRGCGGIIVAHAWNPAAAAAVRERSRTISL